MVSAVVVAGLWFFKNEGSASILCNVDLYQSCKILHTDKVIKYRQKKGTLIGINKFSTFDAPIKDNPPKGRLPVKEVQ